MKGNQKKPQGLSQSDIDMLSRFKGGGSSTEHLDQFFQQKFGMKRDSDGLQAAAFKRFMNGDDDDDLDGALEDRMFGDIGHDTSSSISSRPNRRSGGDGGALPDPPSRFSSSQGRWGGDGQNNISNMMKASQFQRYRHVEDDIPGEEGNIGLYASDEDEDDFDY